MYFGQHNKRKAKQRLEKRLDSIPGHLAPQSDALPLCHLVK